MSAIPDDFPIFGLRPQRGADRKKGRQAEARRPKGGNMLNLLTRTTDESKAACVDAPYSDAHPQEVRRIKSWLETRISAAKQLGAEGLLSEVVTITPAQAQHILAHHNISNRPIRARRVEQWAKTIHDGRFMLTSQGISFSRAGRLNNGQHRLSGVVAAGVAVRVMVTFGEDDDAFAILDTGANRSASDAVNIEGMKYHTAVASAARGHIFIGRGNAHQMVGGDEILDVVRANPMLEDVAADGTRVALKVKTSAGAMTLGLFHIRLYSRFTERYDDFVERLATGADLDKKSPLLKLRDGLRNGTFVVRGNNAKVIGQAAAVVNAWNGFVRGRSVSLGWKVGDPFPRPE